MILQLPAILVLGLMCRSAFYLGAWADMAALAKERAVYGDLFPVVPNIVG